MCINVALTRPPAPNYAQRLAGTGIFFSRPRGLEAAYDDPWEFKVLRLHYERFHQDRSTEPEWGYKYALDQHLYYFRNDADPDVREFVRLVKEDTPFSRGFWKSREMIRGYVPAALPEPEEQIQLATKGSWAIVLQSERCERDFPADEKGAELGGWDKDGSGCFLSYAIPAGQRIPELTGQFEAGPSGLIYKVGHMGIHVPRGTKFALWVRCSDTGAHSGFVVTRLFWRVNHVSVKPILASLFEAPHWFPAQGFFFDPEPVELPNNTEDSLMGAVSLANEILQLVTGR